MGNTNTVKVTWNKDVIDIIDAIDVGVIDIFIIPNRSPRIKNLLSCFQNKRSEEMKDIAAANNLSFDPEIDHLIEVWMSSEALECENLQDHYPRVKDEDENVYFLEFSNYMPESLASTLHEGEEVIAEIPVSVRKYNRTDGYIDSYNRHHFKTTVKCRLRASQTKYRYRRFGTWEECLKLVTK